ncbi:MAG: dipeptidyl-peptidase-4 [Mariniblastus sp.]|jgi:dipeptidyl-peptidase-4
MNNSLLALVLALGISIFGADSVAQTGQTPTLHWSQDGTELWYQKSDPVKGREFFIVDLKRKTNLPAFDHAAISQAISASLNKRIDAKRMPINDISRDESSGLLNFKYANLTFNWDPEKQRLAKVDIKSVPGAESRLFLPPRRGEQGQSTHIVIENQTEKSLSLFWIDNRRRDVAFGILQPGEKKRQHTYAGHVWALKDQQQLLGCFEARLDDHVLITQSEIENVKTETARPRTPSRVPPRIASRSATAPNRRWKAIVKDNNLWLMDLKESNSEAHPLTTDAVQQHTFQRIGSRTRWFNVAANSPDGDLRWSPASNYLVAFQTRQVPEPRVHYIESSPNDQLQPKLRSYQYAKPGDPLPTQTLRLFCSATQKEIPVSHDLFSNPYEINFVGWSKSGDRFWLLYNQRGHQVKRLLEVTPAEGTVRTLIEEQSETFIQYSEPAKSVFQDLPNDEILWASERSGWNHLYRFDRKSGKLMNAVTSGDWNVKRIESVDQTSNTIFFYAVGVYDDQDPYHEHFCRVDLDGSNFNILTAGDGTHEIKRELDGGYFLDTFSRVDLAPITELREMATGELVAELSRGNTVRTFGKRRLTERFVAKGRDGKTDIWGLIHWPLDFDPAKTYPIVENIYAGPHDHHVPKSFRSRYGHQHRIADAGMIVVQIDGMGTAWRSKAFHDVCYKNLKDSGFPDRIAWIKAAAAKHPQMDLARVGIYGGSAGGQSAMAALLWHHDFYKVAVADCGCHDNRMDKIWWNEQWMGWPIDDAYRENSNMENAGLLKGNLMLTVGELDQNVDPASTTQVVGQLIKHNKDFEFVLIVGGGHGAGESKWAAKKRLNFFKQHLQVETQE